MPLWRSKSRNAEVQRSWNEDLQAARSANTYAYGLTYGFYKDVHLIGPKGPIAVQDLSPGNLVETFDHGFQPIRTIETLHFGDFPQIPPVDVWPLRLPAGLLNAAEDRTIAPQQCYLIESDTAEELFGDPFILIPGGAFEVFPSVERVMPGPNRSLYHLVFSENQMVVTSLGAILFCETGEIHDYWRNLPPEADDPDQHFAILTRGHAKELLRRDMERAGGFEQYLSNSEVSLKHSMKSPH